MSISLSRLDPNSADRSGLIDFFTSNDFPFYVRPQQWTAAGVEERIASGAFAVMTTTLSGSSMNSWATSA
ncbi:hypothetical protein [Brevibacterium antiquum]|uniref:hypothetical protein n=1 Tax=Brevibacterium antiquum TaxID=234835 RepID=UPI0018DF2826|nr:hypothetical protein [Brevibacterium antiquum]